MARNRNILDAMGALGHSKNCEFFGPLDIHL